MDKGSDGKELVGDDVVMEKGNPNKGQPAQYPDPIPVEETAS